MPTSTHNTRPTDRFPIFRAQYRVLLLANPESAGTHDRALAYCLEQNLVGRGKSVDAALQDLAHTMLQTVAAEWTDLRPHVPDESEPAAVVAFTDKNVKEYEGAAILDRMKMTLDVWKVVRTGQQTRWATPQVSYEPVAV